MATRLRDFWKADDKADRARLSSLLAQLEESERERRAAMDRLVALTERAKVGSAELRRQLPDLFE